MSFVISNPTFFAFSEIPKIDLFLAIISAIVGFYLLILLLFLGKSPFESWVTRKTIHFIGGTYIAFIVNFFQTLIGIILAIAIFLIIFIILILTSKFKILQDYLILNECREKEKNYEFLINTTTTLIILFILLIVFNNYPAVFTAGTLIVSWADTSGEVIGRKLPILKYKIFNKKTLSGSLAVFVTSFISFVVVVQLYNLSNHNFWLLIISIGSLICTIIEAFSWRWFDNVLLSIVGSVILLWIYLI
jgi:dolichol kinase